MQRTLLLAGMLATFLFPVLSKPASAQQATETVPEKKVVEKSEAESPERATGANTHQLDSESPDREQKLAAYLTGAAFSGKFTVEGREDKLPKTEEYSISKCEKLPEADMYRMTARIKYGDVDSEVPLDIKILWAGNTPVITLDSLWIPGMGTFGARVLIHSGRYAGTWQHDAVGGHMFGQIKK